MAENKAVGGSKQAPGTKGQEIMEPRIEELTKRTLRGEMFVPAKKTAFSREDLFLPEEERNVKRLCAYILNQEPLITEYSCFTGVFRFDGSVVGDAFRRAGHPETQAAMQEFYLKTVDNLTTMEWQHATADYQKVLSVGISGIIADIDRSLAVHTAEEEQRFLRGTREVALALIGWAQKCAARVADFAENVTDGEHKENLLRLSQALQRVPEQAPKTFYEAVLAIYVCFSADPDSLGTPDRYLAPFYEREKAAGTLTDEQAKAYLQELFLMLQACTPIDSKNFTKGGESHFCVGGYLPDGSDGFSDLSRLIVEAVTELPTYIPQITLRWTEKTPREVLRYMMDKERHDPHKRIAFTNDQKRIRCYTGICGIPFERAVGYTTVGCNEPAFLGAITGSTSKVNFLRSMETLFHKKPDTVRHAADFEAFYAAYEAEMAADLSLAFAYDDRFNLCRSRDINYVSSLFFRDCIENAKSLTQGGGNTVIASPMLIGLTNVIDALIVVKQFVFDEKLMTMDELIHALHADWAGYEDMLTLIRNRGDFFGNDTPRSNEIARRLYDSLYRFMKDKVNLFGYHFLVGDILGYNEHHRWFGDKTLATPDGRHAGEMLKFCIGQSEGRDRNGLTALLNSIAGMDPNGIACGSTACNISLDRQLVENDVSFEKLVDVFETYFKNGGVHFQLTYVSAEELRKARQTPEQYRNLRVRVTGFSDYFVNLQESVQDDIIRRTEIRG